MFLNRGNVWSCVCIVEVSQVAEVGLELQILKMLILEMYHYVWLLAFGIVLCFAFGRRCECA